VDKRRVEVAAAVGIVTFEHRAKNQHGELVMRARRNAMMRRAHGLMARRSLALRAPAASTANASRRRPTAADGLILDLEDAVPPNLKAVTRPIVREWLGRDFGGRERWVRMNPIATRAGPRRSRGDDRRPADGVRGAEPRHAGDVREIAQILDGLEHRHGIPHGRHEAGAHRDRDAGGPA